MTFTKIKIGSLVLSAIILAGLFPVSTAAQGKTRAAILSRHASRHKDDQPATVESGHKIKVKTTAAMEYDGTFIEVKDGRLCLERRGEVRLDSLVTNDNRVLVFVDGGARYLPGYGTVSGVASDREKVDIPLADIDHVYVTLADERGSVNTVFDTDAIRRRLKFTVDYPDVFLVPIDSISELYAWKAAKGKGTLGAIGALTGLSIGVVIGLSQYESQKDDFISFPAGFFVVPMAIIGTFGGAKLFSSFVPDEGWKRVSLENVNFGFVPSVNGSPGIAVAVKIPL